jgi:Integrase zinc binding domain
MPKYTIKRVILVVQLAEIQAADNRMLALAKEAGEALVTDSSVVPSFYCAPRQADEAPFCFATSQVINRWTTIPCPTIEEWKDESSKDPDVAYLIERISGKKLVALAKLSAKEYYRVCAKNQLEVEDGILYQWEYPKMARLRQLRRRVVPIGLRQAIYTAYHATPLAGHVGFYKTYWRIDARYYWPSMYSDVRRAVLECGHCILGNNTSHQAQQILGSLSMDDEPFDIIAIDIWIPGATKAKGTYIEDKAMIRQAALTSLCNLTGFATVGFLDSLEGEKVTKVLMSQILLPNGLPKLMVLLDADSLFKQDLIVLLDELGVGFHVVSAEQHEGILCERFH